MSAFLLYFLVGFWILVLLVFGGWLFLTGGAAFFGGVAGFLFFV